ncbi:phage tail tape measure protein [Aeromonas salmonicida]|uniref:phage tail tape measure protein n=1 Tax=Aeromonas salmonicida TaxID=645 RepID=UPI001117F790|nr:phage tail tape measure protein [Aeromonas salmonicida]TNI75964.1 phage tail tape measure protein [Aeromonas salmonicida]
MNPLKLQILLGAVDKLTAPLKAVSGQSRLTAKDLVDTKKKIRDLETQAGQIEGYKTLGAQIGATKAKLKQAEGSFSELQRKIADTPKPTRLMINEFNKAEKALNQLKTKQGEMITRHGQMGEAMRKTGINTGNLSESQRRLKTDLAAANTVLDSQRTKLGQLADQQKRLNQVKANYRKTQELRGQIAGHGATALATGTAVGMTTLKPVIEFARAETSVVDLKVSMMGKGGQVRQEFQAISDLATKLGNKLPGTTADFQNMMSTLIQQGMSAKSILGGLGEATAYLGVQLKMPFDQAALFAAKLQDATGTAENDMMGLMDTIQRSFYLGVDSNNMLGAFSALTPALSVLRKTGLDAANTLAPLIVMADQAALSGESAGNAYRKIFQMSMNPDKIAKATKGTGLKLDFTNGKGEFGGIEKMYTQLAKLKNLNTVARLRVLKGIYGDDKETLQALDIMITKGMDGYRATQKKMADQAALQERVNAQLGTLGSLWDAATGTFTNAMVNFGEAIAPEIKAITEWIAELSERLGNWAKKNPELSNTLMKIGAIVSVVTIAFGGLSLAVAALLGPMAIMKLTFGILGVTFGGMLGAITAVLVPIAALIALGIAIVKFWEPISAFFSGLWQGIMTGLAPVFEAFKPFAPLIDGIGTGVKALSGWFGDLLEPLKFSKETLEGFGSAGEFVGRILGEAFNIALTPLKAFLSGIEWLLESLGILETKKIPKFEIPTPSTPSYANGNLGTPGLSSAYRYGTGNYNQPAALAGGTGYGPRIVEPARIKPVNKQTIDNSINSPIHVYQQPGQSPQDVAKQVRAEMQKMQREEKANQRASLRDGN